jgi:hypothetical protein
MLNGITMHRIAMHRAAPNHGEGFFAGVRRLFAERITKGSFGGALALPAKKTKLFSLREAPRGLSSRLNDGSCAPHDSDRLMTTVSDVHARLASSEKRGVLGRVK